MVQIDAISHEQLDECMLSVHYKKGLKHPFRLVKEAYICALE